MYADLIQLSDTEIVPLKKLLKAFVLSRKNDANENLDYMS